MIEARNDYLIPKLAQLVDYCPEAGLFRWKRYMSSRAPAGAIAGYIDPVRGYRLIKIDGKKVRAARLAYYMVTGALPGEVIDHIDGIMSNDRFYNLQSTTQQVNMVKRTSRRDNSTGFPGVRKVQRNGRDVYLAAIKRDDKWKRLGTFPCPVLAFMAYAAAKHRDNGPLAFCDIPGRLEAARAAFDASMEVAA
jgi:hypothetical protein